jgi:O-antigen ligase
MPHTDFANPPAPARHQSQLLMAAGVLVGIAAFALLPLDLVSWSSIHIMAVAGLLLLCVIVVLISSRSRTFATDRLVFSMSLLLWTFLLVLEQLFPRRGESEAVYEGTLSATAYGEALIWILIAIVTLVLSFNYPAHLRRLFQGSYAVVSVYAVLCLFSAAYAPKPMFSVAFAFKLLLVAVLLQMALTSMRDLDDLRRFTRWTLAAFIVLALLPLGQAFSNPDSAFGWTSMSGAGETDVRLNAIVHPIAVSQWGGIVLLLSMLLLYLDRKKWQFVISLAGATILLLGGGKAAIIAGLFSALLFLILQRSFRSALVFGVSVGCIAVLLMMTTPVFQHFGRYMQSGNVETLTGRTELWEAAMPAIQSHLLFGNGYMASKFISRETEMYWDAGHMHNGFIEALYNNGLVGLLLIVLMNFIIIRNLIIAFRRAPTYSVRTMASGGIALYIFLFLNGLAEANFGGRPSSFFMLFLGLFAFSIALLRKPVRSDAEAIPISSALRKSA